MTAIRDLLLKIKRTFLSEKFIKFCVLGIVNTFNDALFSWIYHFVIQENAAAVLGYFTALTIAFFLNSFFVFKKPISFGSYIRFGLSYIPNFIIYFLVTFLTINTLGLPQFWGTVLAAAAGGPITFVIIKIYAFGKK
ncbi:MAG: GtrA family protein [Acutalibacteraceae bacterium]|nr:GtrA family protein [Acutalibacteraceae bacterium]